MSARKANRIYLSAPHLGESEKLLLEDAIDSNWIAPVGPHIDAFEEEFSSYLGVKAAAALTSGTAAVHLGLRLVGVGPGDEVICPTLTFVASANPILYLGASPVFVDADPSSWNLSPNLLEEELTRRSNTGRMPRAVVAVDVLGQSADYPAIESICKKFGVAVVEDAAESLGATCQGHLAGRFEKCAAFSFNGNKIITTSGGGMLVSNDEDLVREARFLAAQAREPTAHFEHSTLGYNYRMSNLLAAVGRAQMRVLDKHITQRRAVFDFYYSRLSGLPGLEFMPEADYGRCTRWLTCVLADPQLLGVDREELRLALEAENIESRPVWKPLHTQPLFQGCKAVGGRVAEEIFARGLCLPSSSSLTREELERTIEVILKTCSGTGQLLQLGHP